MNRPNVLSSVCASVLIALLTGAALPAQAQSTAPEATPAIQETGFPFPDESPVWRANIGMQLKQSLRSPISTIRAETLQNVVYLAANYRGMFELSPVVPELLRIYGRDRSETHRLMAAAALHHLGDEEGMLHLAQLVRYEPSKHVRKLTQIALADYHNQRYYQERTDYYQRRADRRLRQAERDQQRADSYRAKRHG